jgi:dipeptidyl aminopeptidase/acylaminoacyl peptidase
VVLTVLIVVLVISACGDDGNGGSPSPPATASPAHTPGLSTSPSAPPSALLEQLSYVGEAGAIRLVDADGAGDHVFARSPCAPDEKAQDFSLAWSPDGSALGLVCASEVAPEQTLVVLDADGNEIARAAGASSFRWSPDGRLIAYQTSTLGTDFGVGLLDPSTEATETLNDDAILMEWVGPDSLLLGLNPVPGEFFTEFEAYLVDIESGELSAFPDFDNAHMLWVSPDGSRAIILAEATEPDAPGVAMAVYDIDINLRKRIEGGYIGYPSEFIPHQQLAFSPAGDAIFWANAADSPTSIWRADLDEPVATQLGAVDGIFIAASTTGLLAVVNLPADGGPSTLTIEDLQTGSSVQIGSGGPPFAWRASAITP